MVNLFRLLLAGALGVSVLLSGPASAAPEDAGADPLVEAVGRLERGTEWELVREVPLPFVTHHPQGFARVGDRLFLSTVEILEPTVKGPQPDGSDRTPGKGRGHLLVLSMDGQLLADVVLGEGDIYHPGGIDVDADGDVWVPVAEYRPDSRSIVYTVDGETLEVTERFRYDDHVGGIVRDPGSGKLHGVSWGSRRLITWSGEGELERVSANPSHFVDFQDCAVAGERHLGVSDQDVASRPLAGAGYAVCTGVASYPLGEDATFDLGGIAVVDLAGDRIGAEVPVAATSPGGESVTRNPVHLEVEGDTLRMLAVPDDGDTPGASSLLVLEATLGAAS